MNTNIVEQLRNPNIIEGAAKGLMTEWIWVFAAGVALLLFRELIQEFAAGLGVYFSKQWAVDEIVFLNGRQARIARIGARETVFYMEDRQTAMRVRNTVLSTLTCEKVLTNHAPEYLPKGSEKEPMKVELVEKPTGRKR